MDKTTCPNCGNEKKPWFALCWSCSEKEKQKPKCDVCGIEVPEGHTLCKNHWKEKFDDKKKLQGIEYVKTKKEIEFKEKYPSKFYFDSYGVKSKSELIICYFLTNNGIVFQYERLMILDKERRPDFVIDDQKGNTIIIEHFGMDNESYRLQRELKQKEYKKLCDTYANFYFVFTDEEDILNLKEKLGIKLNKTPLKRPYWK